jgi:hypothetical protein
MGYISRFLITFSNVVSFSLFLGTTLLFSGIDVFFSGFDQEMIRQGIPQTLWRVSFVNAGYSLSPTYPNKLIVPSEMEDEDLLHVFAYRRFCSFQWDEESEAFVI